MFRDSSEIRLLVLGHDPDTDLLALLRAWYPTTRFSLERGELADWLGGLWHQPPSGLVLFGDRLEPSELQAIGAWLHEHPQLPCLLVTGSRGSFGAEAVLAHPGLRTLPSPWTAQALRQVLGHALPSAAKASSAAPTPPASSMPDAAPAAPDEVPAVSSDSTPDESPLPAFAAEFLDGLIERVRDPLASLSGYLQLLQSESANGALVKPALEAARELDGVLESLHLASEGWAPHPSRHRGEHLAVEALKDAQRAGHEVAFGQADDFLLRVDPRLTTAALQTARVLLARFGGGGELRLRCRNQADAVEILFDLTNTPEIPAGSKVEIPAFLRLLLERFAERAGAEAVLELADAGVPRSAGLRWPESALVKDS